MPAIQSTIAAEWKRGNYINGPQFGASVEAPSEALRDSGRLPKGENAEGG